MDLPGKRGSLGEANKLYYYFDFRALPGNVQGLLCTQKSLLGGSGSVWDAVDQTPGKVSALTTAQSLQSSLGRLTVAALLTQGSFCFL